MDDKELKQTSNDSDLWLNVKEHSVSGSNFDTMASFKAGSREIKVEDIGDFATGQGVTVSGNDLYQDVYIWPAESQKIWQTDVAVRPIEAMYHSVPDPKFGKISQHHRYSEGLVKAVSDEVELRGYDGSLGNFAVFYIEIDGLSPLSFRWSEDAARHFNGERIEITGDWQKLSAGLEIRFNKKDWSKGDSIAFDCRNSLITEIESIDGDTIILKDPVKNDCEKALVRHEDSLALQKIMDKAIRENRNIHFPSGTYRLLRGISVLSASDIRIEGSVREETLLDTSEGVGACFWLYRGERVTVRNLKMVGHTSKELGFPFHLRNVNGRNLWRNHNLKPARAVETRGARQVLVEDLSVEKISLECFYSQSPCRENRMDGITESLVYSRCMVYNCGFNAFDSNNQTDKTTVMNCHITDVANCAWEGPGRHVKFIGNHIKNSGPCAIGGQTILENNIFEGENTGKYAVTACRISDQIIIRNNVFVNYNDTAIELYSAKAPGPLAFPVANIIVAGNIIDLTAVDVESKTRCGIRVGVPNVNISDNQIYTRNDCESETTGIFLLEPVRNVNIHDNLIQNCGKGIHTRIRYSFASEIIDECSLKRERTFMIPENAQSDAYKGWNCFRPSEDPNEQFNVVESYDKENDVFTMREPHGMSPGNPFFIYHNAANWNLHDNTIDGCRYAVVFESLGGASSVLKNNMISAPHGDTPSYGIVSRGRLNIISNNISGFSSEGSAGIYLAKYPFSTGVVDSIIKDNVLSHCGESSVMESHQGLWDSVNSGPIEKQIVPKTFLVDNLNFTSELTRPKYLAAKVAGFDGIPDSNSISIDCDPGGWPVDSMKADVKCGWNDSGVLVKARFTSKIPFAPDSNYIYGDWCKGDGMGIAFSLNGDENLVKLLGLFDGTYNSTLHRGKIDSETLEAFKDKVEFSVARAGDFSWDFTWILPMDLLGFEAKPSLSLPINFGFHNSKNNTWISWVPGEEHILYGYMFSNVVHAGEVVFVEE